MLDSCRRLRYAIRDIRHDAAPRHAYAATRHTYLQRYDYDAMRSAHAFAAVILR